MVMMEEEQVEKERPVIFRDIRRYYCDYCGICRSKKSLITSHVLTHHKEEMEEESVDGDEGKEGVKSNTCEKCGASFKKPAYLIQHMQSHSLERPFKCLFDDCHASYRRKDHLTRHLLQHEGKLFKCQIENCNREFVYPSNLKRHVRELHDESSPSSSFGGEKQYVCQEPGCGKAFRYPSKLRKHEDSHVSLDHVEAMCLEPGCMKHFSNKECLKAHIQSSHQYINCDMCGTKQLKKNIKRHLRTHEPASDSTERIKCHFKGCQHTFSTKTNLNQHVKAVHLEHRPFLCGFPGCDMRFSYKHVRDNHEKSGLHVYTPGDFVESDRQFRSKPRGGRKRKFPTVEMLIRKRVTPPTKLDECHPWLNEIEREDQ
ncbi:transcription factor IIIA-like [Populus nigra]|uniref:transcription factor IIIA-like n=1 Tax=Populus nigra TaxID=3691 RepID=UPI002B278633|nr:transcription factor IIIA-like [Populus nigra]